MAKKKGSGDGGTAVATVAPQVPQNLDEAAEGVRKIGAAQRALDQIRTALNEDVKVLQASAMAEAQPHEHEILALFHGLSAFADANRTTLTQGGETKTVDVATGTFGWRTSPPRVEIEDVKAVVASLKRRKRLDLLRIKDPEVDKKALLKEPDLATQLPGVSIRQDEDFFVKPIEIGVEVTADKLAKAVG